MTREQLVGAIAQTARELDGLSAEIGTATPTADQQAWWDGLVAEHQRYVDLLAEVDEVIANRVARLPVPP